MDVSIPAVCTTCGRSFPSGFRFQTSSRGTIRGSIGKNLVGPCPYCGGTGETEPATYDLVGDALTVVREQAPTAQQVAALSTALQGLASQPNTSSEELDETLSRFGQFGQALRKMLAAPEWQGVSGIAALVAILLAVLALYQAK